MTPTDNNVDAIVELVHVLPDGGTANAGMTLSAHVVAKSHDDLLDLLGQLPSGSQDQSLAGVDFGVNLLQDGNGEGGRFASSGLGLSDDIMTLDARNDGALLDGRGLFETVCINAAEELLAQVHVIEVLANLVPVGVDETLGIHAGRAIVASATTAFFGCRCWAVGFPLISSRGSRK